jgi:hypothetical protein
VPEQRDVALSSSDEVRVDAAMRMRLRAAANRARKIYPGPVGELLHRELISWDEVGFMFGCRGLMIRLVNEIMDQPLEGEKP